MDDRAQDRSRGRLRQVGPQFAAAGIAVVMVLGACGNGGVDGTGTARVAAPNPVPSATVPPATPASPPGPGPGPAMTMAATSVAVLQPPVAAGVSAPPATPAATAKATTVTTIATPTTTSTTAAPQAATLHGVVTRAGMPVDGAKVTMVGDDGGERTTTTDPTGSYRFASVPAGHYQLLASAESGVTCGSAGCISASWMERTEVTLVAGETRRLDVNGD